MANYPHYRSQFGDTTFTKVFVGGLAWETPTEEMRRYFEQFGDILEAVIITDKNTGKSKGYGFVTFRDAESARRACADPNPVIDGRRANCNIASLGRPRPSPPRGRNQVGNYQSIPYQGGGAASYRGVAGPLPPPPPPAPPLIYAPYYGYTTYTPDYGYHQAVYNPQVQQTQYYQQVYGASSSNPMGASPYYYGYSLQAPTPRGAYPAPHQPQRLTPPAPSYLYYSSQLPDATAAASFPPPPHPFQLTRHPFPSPSSDSQAPQHTVSGETEGGVNTSDSAHN